MTKKYSKYYIYFLAGVLFLITLACIVYLPGYKSLGYSESDLNLFLIADSQGSDALAEQYNEISPTAGKILKYAYQKFGSDPAPYYLYGIFFRLLGGMFFWVTLFIIWPTERTADLTTAAYFLVFPGFLQQTSGITFFPHQIALLFFAASLCLMISSFFLKSKILKAFLIIISVALTIAELSVMDCYIGLEVFRITFIFFCLYLHTATRLPKTFIRTAICYTPWFAAVCILAFTGNFMYGPMGIKNEVIVNTISPLISQNQGFFAVLGELIRNTGKSVFEAWTVPTYNVINNLGIMAFWPVMVKAGICMALYFLIVQIYWNLNGPVIASHDLPKDYQKSEKSVTEYAYERENIRLQWQAQWIIMALISSIFVIFPMVLAGKSIAFNTIWDWISYPGALCSSMIICGLIMQLRIRNIEWCMMVLMIGIGSITQIANIQNQINDPNKVTEVISQVSLYYEPVSESFIKKDCSEENFPVNQTCVFTGQKECIEEGVNNFGEDTKLLKKVNSDFKTSSNKIRNAIQDSERKSRFFTEYCN